MKRIFFAFTVVALLGLSTVRASILGPEDSGIIYQNNTVGLTIGADGYGTNKYYYIQKETPLGPEVTTVPAALVFGLTVQQFVDQYSPVPVQLP